MKSRTIFPIFFAALFFHSLSFAGAPMQIAGIRLGAPINEYKDLIKEETTLPIRHMEYISEVEMKPLEGYKSGYIFYGNCSKPGKIVKVKLKYLRDDREFFNDLLNIFKKKFGKATEFKGDPFGGLIAWKWSFIDEEKNRISLILQHSSVDEEEYTSGNSIKMAITSAIEKERECYKAKHPEEETGERVGSKDKLKDIKDLDKFIPQ